MTTMSARHIIKRKPPQPLAAWHDRLCPYCECRMAFGGSRRPTRDHVIPRSKGGTLNVANKLIVCAPCNGDKGDLDLQEFYKKLKAANDYRAPIINALIRVRWRRQGAPLSTRNRGSET